MLIHENGVSFSKEIFKTTEITGLPAYYIEKDYFICLLLNELNRKIDGLVFKGGTALSKCFHIIDRFSEDIDLTLDIEHFTKSNKINANHIIKDSCKSLNLSITNINYVDNHIRESNLCCN